MLPLGRLLCTKQARGLVYHALSLDARQYLKCNFFTTAKIAKYELTTSRIVPNLPLLYLREAFVGIGVERTDAEAYEPRHHKRHGMGQRIAAQVDKCNLQDAK